MTRPDSPNAKTHWRVAVLGAAVGLLIATVVFAPARWLSGWVQSASQGQVMLLDSRGTLWSGSAVVKLTGGAGSLDATTLPGRLGWVVSPSLSGATVQLLADCCMQQALTAQVNLRWNGVQLALSDNQSQWPAQLLTGLGTPWNTVQAQGDLGFSTRALTLVWTAGRLTMSGQAQVDALNLSSHLSTLRPMGSYRFSINGGASPTLTLTTLQGSLNLSGNGQWVGGQLRFNGEASADPLHLDALSNLLNIIGRRNGARAIIKVG